MKPDDKVWFRGRFTTEYSHKGQIEIINDRDNPLGDYGIRLSNGNFYWADKSQVKPRD